MKDNGLDGLMKSYYTAQPDIPSRSEGCPSFESLASYASGRADKGASVDIESHLAACEACAGLVADARLFYRCGRAVKKERVPAGMRRQAKMSNPNYKEKDNIMSWTKKNKWLIVCALSLALSFKVPRYYMQFLIVAVLFGMKWIFDSGSTKTLVMVYNAWKRHDETGRREIDNILSKR